METTGAPQHLRPPKWRKAAPGGQPPPISTGDLVRALRHELWAQQLSPDTFSHFSSSMSADTNAQKLKVPP